MSAAVTVLCDGGLGEARRVMLGEDGRPATLEFERAGEMRARWHELFVGRVRSVDRRLRGAFVDIGLGETMGFQPLTASGKARVETIEVDLREGDTEFFLVKREAARGKAPVLDVTPGLHKGQPIGLLKRFASSLDPMARHDADADAMDSAVDEALAKRVHIPGGGMLTIEPTAALVAIDVDAGTRKGSGDAEQFALDLNIAAAKEAARQLRLRNLGGIVAIDFVSMRTYSSREALEAAAKAAFHGDPWKVQRGRLSKFGVLELAREQMLTPHHERMLDEEGKLSVETIAHRALRALRRAGAADGGRRIAGRVAPAILAWLEAANFDWRGALDGRIGPRWEIGAAADFPREKIDVHAI